MKIVVVYHSQDLDGWMSAAIVKHWWNSVNHDPITNSIEFIGYTYGQPIPDLSEYDKVIMCDISFPKEEMYKLLNKLQQNLIYIDHHISAIKDILDKDVLLDENGYTLSPVNINGLCNTKFAACELTWKYFFPEEPMPEIVRLLGRYDCFGSKGTDEHQKVLEFQYGARAFIKDYSGAYSFLIEELTERTSSIVARLHMQGLSIYQYLCTEAKQVYKNGFEILLCEPLKDIGTNVGLPPNTRKFICINKERFNPVNFGIDYHKEGYDGAACFHYANGKWNFSLYNDNGLVDCSVIAKQFGGGGHRGSSGFVVDSTFKLMEILGETHMIDIAKIPIRFSIEEWLKYCKNSVILTDNSDKPMTNSLN